MKVILYISGVLLLIIGIIITVLVMMQQGHEKNMGVVTGSSSDTYIGKNKAKTFDSAINKWTTVLSIVLVLLTILVILLSKYAV